MASWLQQFPGFEFESSISSNDPDGGWAHCVIICKYVNIKIVRKSFPFVENSHKKML